MDSLTAEAFIGEIKQVIENHEAGVYDSPFGALLELYNVWSMIDIIEVYEARLEYIR